jgi:NAD+ synthase
MDVARVIDHITNWLSIYVSRSGTSGFTVGVSGGIDSAVTSTLGARTGLEMLCVEMPIHQASNQVSRARQHIEWLESNNDNVSSVEVSLSGVYDDFIDALAASTEGALPGHDIALVNSRARLRMTTLYYHAAARGLLVLGTGNKVEDFGVGFYTKYGDGGVDVSPIADLTKTQVYAVGKELGISDEIMHAAPTDGLWGDDRTDEDQIGASYPELEWAMEYSGNGDDLSDREQEVLIIYRRMNNANKHKMNPIPVCEIPPDMIKS